MDDSGQMSPAVRPHVQVRLKTREESMDEYIRYYERIIRANGYSPKTAAQIFPAVIESDSIVQNKLAELTEAEREDWAKVKAAIDSGDEPYRDGHVVAFNSLKLLPNEAPEKLKERIQGLIEKIYPRFAKSNKELLLRDKFICSLPDQLRLLVLQQHPKKIEDAVCALIIVQNARREAGAEKSPVQQETKSYHKHHIKW